MLVPSPILPADRASPNAGTLLQVSGRGQTGSHRGSSVHRADATSPVPGFHCPIHGMSLSGENPLVSRRYPLDSPSASTDPAFSGARRSPRYEGLAIRSASAVARALLEFLDYRRRHADVMQLFSGILLLAFGIALATSAAITDSYLHRGVESGAEQPYVVQPTGKDLATNVDLRIFPADQLESVSQALDSGGFRYVRQTFSWAQIEQTQGSFDWSLYDRFVEHLNRREIGVIAVVTQTPSWAIGRGAEGFADAPPNEPALLRAFTEALTSHFRDAVPFVQVWDQPNVSTSWGGSAATADAFLPYLAAAFNGARAGNSEVKVISPELAIESDSIEGPGDLEFVRSLYLSNGRPFFDVLGIALDGGTYSPDDRRTSSDRFNFSRAILFRDLMLDEEDQSTPIWATSFGWAARANISRDEQAEFVLRGMERSWSEWPWLGLMVQWAFLAPPESAEAPYAVVLPDGTATTLYRRLVSSVVNERAQRANTGFAPMDSDAVSYGGGSWQPQHLENRTFQTTSQVGSSATFAFQGTGLIMFVRSGPDVGSFILEIDGKVVPGGGGESGDEWSFSGFSTTNDLPRTVKSGLADSQHIATVTLTTTGELTLGGFVVERDPPFVWPVILMTVSAMILLFFALRSFAYLVAIKTGHMRRLDVIDVWPQLPHMPDWRPGRRI